MYDDVFVKGKICLLQTDSTDAGETVLVNAVLFVFINVNISPVIISTYEGVI